MKKRGVLENILQIGNVSFLRPNLVVVEGEKTNHTEKVFSYKWSKYTQFSQEELNSIERQAKQRFLKLYGFSSEEKFKNFLNAKSLIYDAGCGRGHKTAWIAELAPHALVIGIDIADSVVEASEKYSSYENLIFIRGDITKSIFKNETFDFIVCDQVLHHTKNPPATLRELVRVLKQNGEIATYVYAKKALPRELIDEYFRKNAKKFTHDELMKLSEQLTLLGKILTNLNVKIDVPDIPLLQIKGGEWDLQRFIYYNFIKCYWNESLGWQASVMTNYDWYAPSLAFRYSEEEFKCMLKNNGLKIIFFYKDEMASYSGRFKKEQKCAE